ncbi:MAG: hypothetical protein HZC54_22500 [Verrucomicrobia bacterium]|nr:hypothetical protein [Verrucomicrobiota bacterium]
MLTHKYSDTPESTHHLAAAPKKALAQSRKARISLCVVDRDLRARLLLFSKRKARPEVALHLFL